MFKNQLKSLCKRKEGEENTEKRKIENVVFFILVLIITIVMINLIWNGKKTTNKSTTNATGKQLANQNVNSQGKEIETNEMEQKLESILAKMQGVRGSKGVYSLFRIK